MHPDGIRDGFQGKRSHRLHAVNEKAVLLANDFLRHLENGTSALVEAFDQPLRGAEAFAEIKLVLLPRTVAAHGGIILFVDQHSWQGVAVELHEPASIRRLSYCRVRHDSLHDVLAERRPWLGIESHDFRRHVLNVFRTYPA